MYEYACVYYRQHGNLEVPNSFKTNNGYEEDENGEIRLGEWIVNQRQRTSPESERGQLLSKIGMRFEEKRKNRDLITNICNENNVDTKLNKNTINRIPYREFMSKIEFLKEKNISLLDKTGKLHEIFSMSNTNMKQKYNITLEELIDNYYIKGKEKGN
ncbi:MAG: helicase associated domain-containing protein [bacterium]|nr:helicase associated domain-containing protein [bacterium]